MAAELGLLSLTQLQKLAQSHQQNPSTHNTCSVVNGSWMWNPKQQATAAMAQDEDDSWEVRAFQEDTNQAMGTTWPPRSYTCTFCRREFRSAQALGGHMNVHRRDRARLHQIQPGSSGLGSSASTNSPTLIIPTQEFMANGGLCLLYSLPNPNPNGAFSPTKIIGGTNSPSTLLSVPPFPTSQNFPVASPSINSSFSHSSNTEPSASLDNNDNNQSNNAAGIEELDLELRLGPSSSLR